MLLLCGVLAALLAWLALFWQPTRGDERGLPAGGDFTLQGADGPVSLSDYRGKVVVLYFGYTFCPDICPTSLSLLAQAFASLRRDELDRVRGLLISIDPERDTPEVLKIYAPFFHPNISGVGGTTQQIAQTAARYGARYAKQKADADGNYAVDHSAYTYIVGTDGRLAARLPHGSPPETIVAAIRPLLANAR